MRQFLRLHAGGIGRAGIGALLVGPNGAGKSTLVVRLVSDGFSLLSDDEIWIDPDSLLLYPSSRPLLLKESAWDFFPQYRQNFVASGEPDCRSWWLSPDDLRPGCRVEAVPAGAVVLLGARNGGRPLLESVGQTEALRHVLDESMNFPEVGDAGLAALVRIISTARLFRLTVGDLDQCAELLAGVLP